MSALAVLLFILSMPLSMAMGMRFGAARDAFRRVGILSGAAGALVVLLLAVDSDWLSVGTLGPIWLISTAAPMALGMAAWRTPDLIDSMQVEFNRVVEPYAGRPVSLLGWAHRLYDLVPERFCGRIVKHVG